MSYDYWLGVVEGISDAQDSTGYFPDTTSEIGEDGYYYGFFSEMAHQYEGSFPR